MRERRATDRVTDLAGRHVLETAVAQALTNSTTLRLVHTATDSCSELDYTVIGPGRRIAAIELKAKLQPYQGWDRHAPTIAAHDLFILDELALRKLIEAGRYAFLIVWDQPIRRWCVWSNLDLVLTPKTRVARPLAGTGLMKAKVLIDLDTAAHTCTDLPAVLDAITQDIETCDQWWTSIAPWPYGPTIINPYRRTS